MALITAKTIITSVSLFHITLAYFFLTNPSTINDQAIVYILGESMALVSPSNSPQVTLPVRQEANPITQPPARGLDSGSPALSLLAVILATFGLTDLTSLSMPEELGALYYWGTQGAHPS